MRLAVFGGTRGTGLEVVKRALEAGHDVTLLARTPEALTFKHPRLTVIKGDARDPSAVARVLPGAAGVVISLGTKPMAKDNSVSEGTRVIVQEMHRAGISRVVAVSSIGVGESRAQLGAMMKVVMSTLMRRSIREKVIQEGILRGSGLNWTVVRPSALTNGARADSFKVDVESAPLQARNIPRANVAEFVLHQFRDGRWLLDSPSITL